MTQENIKDLCSRLPYGVIVDTPKGKGHACDINFTIFGVEIGVNINTTVRDTFSINDVKPYLRPMSSMTEEEAKELSILCDITGVLSIKITDEYIDFEVDDGFSSIETKIIWFNDIISSIEIFDWLNKNHFDYRGLIPMGLAIAVTKENNPYKK